MNIHIIIDHPWRGSFNYAILEAFSEGLDQAGHSIDLLDLNQEEFNPVFSAAELALYANGGSLDPNIDNYQQRLMAADFLAMIFPIWWYVMPARLKGWMDKVLLPGFAFSKGQYPEPMLKHIKGGMILTTSAVSNEVIRETYHNALDWVLCKGTLAFCGISPVTWQNFGETGFASREDHETWLNFIRTSGSDL
jgi:putative NADPH-quinone reductase